MTSNDSNTKTERTPSNSTHQEPQSGRRSTGKRVTEARARAQRTKLDTQEQVREQQAEQTIAEEPKKRGGHQEHHARRRTKLTVEQGIEDYLHDHEGGNHSHYNRTFKAEQCKDVKEKKASRSSSHCCDIL